MEGIEMTEEDPLLRSERALLRKLTELEKEDQLLTTLVKQGVVNGTVTNRNSRESSFAENILLFMDTILEDVSLFKMAKLKDANLQSLICDAFYKRESVRSKWNACELPLFGGLLVIYICERMKQKFERTHESLIAEEYEKLREEFDLLCMSLLDKCSHENARQTGVALTLDYHSILYTDASPRGASSLELMAIASKGQAQNFLAHSSCQRVIDNRWQPGFKLGALEFLLYFSFPPVFVIRKIQGKSDIFWHFYTSPNSKYIIHSAFRAFYIIVYASVLVGCFSWVVGFAIIQLWHATYILEMAVNYFRHGFERVRQHKIDLFRNLIFLTCYCSVYMSILPWQNVRLIARLVVFGTFYISFVFATVRSMRVLNVDAFFGSIVLVIKETMPILVKFSIVFGIFWFAYSICNISLVGHFHPRLNGTEDSFVWLFFSNGAFEIFGEADEDEKQGLVLYCSEPFRWDNITDDSILCLFTTWMVPFLLFIYMLVSSILLGSLITALLTKKFDDISRYSKVYWKSKLYDRLIEHEEHLWIPVPLSVFFYITHSFVVAFAPRSKFRKFLTRFEGKRYDPKPYNGEVEKFIIENRNALVKSRDREESRQMCTETIIRNVASRLKRLERKCNYVYRRAIKTKRPRL